MSYVMYYIFIFKNVLIGSIYLKPKKSNYIPQNRTSFDNIIDMYLQILQNLAKWLYSLDA